jgi:hypothetical protein
MSIISAGTLTSNALRHTADRTGRLVFQTNGTTTALTLDSSQDATFAGGVTVTGNLTVAGTTTSFGDNDKIVLGDGNDLQLYHDGSNSYIDDAGAGRLYIRASDHITFTNASGTETYANFAGNGAVGLRYDNSTKLVTTNTGISVTGTVAATSFSGDGSGLTGVSLPTNVITANDSAAAGNHYYLNGASLTLTLPASPSVGDEVRISEVAGNTDNIIARNGSNIMGSADDITIDTAYLVIYLRYVDATIGWAFS